MPAGKGDVRRDSAAANTVKRETFRPPWVREGSDALPPKPSNFAVKRQQSKDVPDAAGPNRPSTVKTSQAQNNPQENGNSKESTFVIPQLKKVPPRDPDAKLQSKEVKVPIKLNSVADRILKEPPREDPAENLEKAIASERTAIVRQESMKKLAGNVPRAPPMPPPAPALPKSQDAKDLKPLSERQAERLQSLRTRPKVRPDFNQMLKEVETGRKLKHVQCNDRSKPLLPKVKDKDKGQFLYESEKPSPQNSVHNELLKQIQGGIKLNKVKTNDRSKPILEGLRKFRRQMTIEEQIQKSQSMASIPPEEIVDETDELDDIDRVRDDLQSTKQLLALEMRNKEAQIRENKRLQARILQLEVEVEKEKTSPDKQAQGADQSEAHEKLLKSLKSEAADARKIAEDLEKKFSDAASQLDNTKSELDEIRKQKQLLEKKLQETLQGKRMSIADRKLSTAAQSESEDEPEEVEEPDSGGEDTEEKRARRAEREVKLFATKLLKFKNKEDNARKERMALKTQIKRLQAAMKDEKKKYKGLQKEVDKMAKLMRDVGDDDEDVEEDEEEKEETESESESSESETESSEEESESEKSVSEAEDAPVEKKKENLTNRSKKHENRLSALKKGNFLLKTNVERLQDDLNKQKEESVTLQQDLDSVLAELG